MTDELIKGFIYKLTCSQTSNSYFGSTTKPNERLRGHLSPNNKCMSRFLINPTMEVIEEIEYNPNNNRPLLLAERSYIESNSCVNKKVPLRSRLELYNIKKQNPNFFKNMYIQRGGIAYNIRTRKTCECGGVYIQRNKKRHLETEKHKNFILSNIN